MITQLNELPDVHEILNLNYVSEVFVFENVLDRKNKPNYAGEEEPGIDDARREGVKDNVDVWSRNMNQVKKLGCSILL